MNEKNTTIVAKIKDVDILVIQDGEKMIPIKPICDVLGIASNKQIERIKEDEILSSVSTLRVSTGRDGKEYEMFSIPFKYVFGWLFTIDPARVKPEAKEMVIKYKVTCYDALYCHFTSYADFVETKQKAIEAHLEKVEAARFNFKNAKNVLEEENTKLNRLRKLTFEDYDAESKQLKLFSDDEMKGGDNE